MGHNYARPLTPEVRFERLMGRLPADWAIRIEREAGQNWRVWMQPPGREGQWSAGHDVLIDAMEDVWRAVR
ncbi:hypothetical protein [Gluconobacter morbifer]|nr:hypothetical protein [Gluconobacter morbifer]